MLNRESPRFDLGLAIGPLTPYRFISFSSVLWSGCDDSCVIANGLDLDISGLGEYHFKNMTRPPASDVLKLERS
jgi:hypothetical protein